MKLRVIDGCPVPASIAPYIAIVLADAGQSATSILRSDGPNVRRILHAHGKRTQAEIHVELPAISNPPGYSEHELRSDGNDGSGVPRGGELPEWMVGVDSGTNDAAAQARVTAAAHRHGWHVVHPYKRGVEGHHWRFAHRPRPHSHRMRLRILHKRLTLPRR